MNIEEFIDKYSPIMNEQTDDIKQFDWTVEEDIEEIVIARTEKRLATVVEEESVMILESGWHYINRMYYVITEVPIEETDLIIQL